MLKVATTNRNKATVANTADRTVESLHKEIAHEYVESLFAFSVNHSINYPGKIQKAAGNRSKAPLALSSEIIALHKESARDYIETLFAELQTRMLDYYTGASKQDRPGVVLKSTDEYEI